MNDLNTQLLWAATTGDTPACLDLLMCGADIEAISDIGDRPLLRSALNGHSDICLLLIQQGASIHVVDKMGDTSLHKAVWGNHANTCFVLLESGVDPLTENYKGKTALDEALEYKFGDCAGLIASFITAAAARSALQEITCAGAPRMSAP